MLSYEKSCLIKKKNISTFKLDRDNLLLTLVMFIPILVGNNILIDIFISTILCGAMVYFLRKDKYILLLPIFMLYSPQLFLYPNGLSLINVYALMYVLRLFLFATKIKFRIYKFLLATLFLYSFIVVLYYTSLYNFIILVLGMIALIAALSEINDSRNEDLRLKFLKIYIFMCFSASFYGLLNENIRVNYGETLDSFNKFARYSGTQNDPNYMAMFLCIGFSFLLGIKIKNNIQKWSLAIGLFIMISFTGSITGLICSLIALFIHVTINKDINKYKKIAIFIVAVFFVYEFIIYLMNQSSDSSLFSMYSLRVNDVIREILNSNFEVATSGRTGIQKLYLNFYFEQNIFRQLFGGYSITSVTLKGLPFSIIGVATHNTYIDILLTTGLFGSSIFFLSVINSFKSSFTKYNMKSDNQIASILIAKLIWLIFATSISTFPSWTYFFVLYLI